LQDFVMSLDDSQPRFRHEKWREVFDNQLKSGPLSLLIAANPLFALPLGEHEGKWEVYLTKEKLWDRINTLSQVATLKGQGREVEYILCLF